ncbi:MAG: hypothetical protein JWM34_180 [Ilumatobacteraceae bacterium]|nr:hypothetical protein [Ilumatobacteraceae bacterium]
MTDRPEAWRPPTPPTPPPGWFADPWGGPALRFWDGVQWTAQSAAPVAPRPVTPPYPSLPLRAAVIALIATAAALTADKFVVHWLLRYHWPVAVYVVVAAVVGYGPLVVTCRVVSERLGTGDLGADLGLRLRRSDLGWGPVAWTACYVAEIAVVIAVKVLHIPLASNLEGASKMTANRTYVVVFALLAVVAAPVVEEMVFRGLVMRGLRSRFSAPVAVGVQGLLFGIAHFDPVRGLGNIGLVMILASVGIVLGGAAYLTRRLAPTMIAHALFNGLALIVLLTR